MTFSVGGSASGRRGIFALAFFGDAKPESVSISKYETLYWCDSDKL